MNTIEMKVERSIDVYTAYADNVEEIYVGERHL